MNDDPVILTARGDVDMPIDVKFDLDGPSVADQSPGKRVISGFWRRSLAFILDGLLLGVVGVALGLFFFDFLARLGGWGSLLGFGVTLVYFGVLNSSIAGGQTIGKRIMKIQVVDRAGQLISLVRSALRYTVLGAPFFLNHLIVPPIPTAIGYLIVFIMLGFGGAILYLFIFNRRTRQSLHDLIAGTFVTRTTPPGHVVGSIWSPHLVVVSFWLVAVIGLSAAETNFSRQGVFPGLLKVQSGIQATGKVHMAEVFVGEKVSTVDGNRKVRKYFSTNAVWNEPPADFDAEVRQVASIILRDYPEAMNVDVIEITISYGFDIGIARAWRNQTIDLSPAQWAAGLAEPRR
jgi:uncharacterized RDD family membrane protein YckC